MGNGRDSDHSIGHHSVVAESVMYPRHDVEPLAENKQEEINKLQLEEYLLKQLLYQLDQDRNSISFATELQREVGKWKSIPTEDDEIGKVIGDLIKKTIIVARPTYFPAETKQDKDKIKITKIPNIQTEPTTGRYISIICKFVDDHQVDNYILFKVTTDLDFISATHEQIQKKILELQNIKASEWDTKKN